MKVLFENNKGEIYDENCELSGINYTLLDDGVEIEILNANRTEGDYSSESQRYYMPKAQLREFIGALLHAQQKLAKKGGNQNG